MAIDIVRVKALTFDCYGTIIDWDGGIGAALAAIESLATADMLRLVSDREREEYALLSGPYQPYGDVLAESMLRAAALQSCSPSQEEARVFAASMGDWPAFSDSAAALQRLGERFRLALLSNVENATLKRSAAKTGASFVECVSAEGVRSYKPARAHFDEGLRRLELEPGSVLHVAGSLYHDIRPAHALGWTTIWVNRRGEAIPSDLDPEHVVPDLETLARLLC